jgi:prepilin-type N-terminal cleavage/methylation domain-containing protein|tara:strand:- start:41 stop:529 length:489 start_codon:yes stop_codon:yes gene_type:complete
MTSQTGNPSFRQKGFTLVEMLVVLAIIAMIMGLSVPFTTSFGKGLKIKTSARAIVGTIRLARSYAITRRKEYTIVFDVENNEYWIEDSSSKILEKKRRFPSSIKFKIAGDEDQDPVTFEDDKVTFNATGAIEGISGSITITDRKNQSRTISIIGSTGKITVE